MSQYTKEQIQSEIKLLKQYCAKHSIPFSREYLIEGLEEMAEDSLSAEEAALVDECLAEAEPVRPRPMRRYKDYWFAEMEAGRI